MEILFDQGTPIPLRAALTKHQVFTAFELGWAELKNGELLDAAESKGIEILVTTDRNLKYQQNLTTRSIAIVVLTTPSWPRIQRVLAEVVTAIDNIALGGYVDVTVP